MENCSVCQHNASAVDKQFLKGVIHKIVWRDRVGFFSIIGLFLKACLAPVLKSHLKEKVVGYSGIHNTQRQIF